MQGVSFCINNELLPGLHLFCLMNISVLRSPEKLIKILIGAWVFICVMFAIKDVCLSPRSADTQTVYNNYVIFKQSFFHFIQGKSLYIGYPAEHYDFYKYSPTFSLFFGVFAALPDWLGLALWNLLNVMVLLTAILRIKGLSPFLKCMAVLLLSQELFISTINEQSNALITGLALWAYIFAEKGRIWPVVFLIWLTVFIKLFGIVLFVPLLLYKNRWRYILPGIVTGLVLFAVPLIFNSWQWYNQQLRDYLDLLNRDHAELVKFSVMAWIRQWFGVNANGNLIVLAGLIIQLITLGLILFKQKQHNKDLRTLYWLSWLIWMVIFNHMAESPTFIIAVTGIVLWYVLLPVRKPVYTAVMFFVLVFTSFSSSDLIPKSMQPLLTETLQLKVFPCILVFAIIIWHLVHYSLQPAQQEGQLTQK